MRDHEVEDDNADEETGQVDIDELMKENFAARETVKRKRTLRGGIGNSVGEKELEDELNIPAFLRSRLGNKKDE